MGEIDHTEGQLGQVAYAYVRELTRRLLFAMAEEVAPSVA